MQKIDLYVTLLNSHPGQSVSLSWCGPISISRANAHMVHMGPTKLALHITLKSDKSVEIYSATRPTFVKTYPFLVLVHVHCRDFNIFSSHGLLPSDLVAQSVERRRSNPKVVGSIATLVRVFLCPGVGPFPLVGLTLTWFIWKGEFDQNLAHIFTCSVMKMIFNQGGRINTNECISQTCFDGEIRLKCHSFYVFTTLLLSYGYYNYHSDSENKTLVCL